MTAKRVKMTAHVIEERLDRLTYIAMNVGFGEVVLEHPHEDGSGKVDCLTDTGVLIIKSAKTGAIITAYIPDIGKVTAIYHKMGYTRIPTAMNNKIMKNVYHAKMSNIVKY